MSALPATTLATRDRRLGQEALPLLATAKTFRALAERPSPYGDRRSRLPQTRGYNTQVQTAAVRTGLRR